jgi:hypothetical protein
MKYTSYDGQWCKVEIMGHVEHIARAKEVPLLDGKALRVCDETEQGPIEYGLVAIFSLRWMSEEEGARAAAIRAAEREEESKRRLHDVKIAAIQQTIREVIDGKKMTIDDLYAAILVVTPGVQMNDFAEAVDEMGLDVIHGLRNEPSLYWIDPDSMPF